MSSDELFRQDSGGHKERAVVDQKPLAPRRLLGYPAETLGAPEMATRLNSTQAKLR